MSASQLDKGVLAVSFAVSMINLEMKKKKIIQTLMKNYGFRVREARIIYKVALKSVKTTTEERGTPRGDAVSVETVLDGDSR